MDKIPTNHGMMGIQSIFDHLNYVSYKTQRDAGMTAEVSAKWYPNPDELEKRYSKVEQFPNKEWEIVSYQHSNNSVIRSVRRLSDGEVFSIGDMVSTNVIPSGCTITEFRVEGDRLIVTNDKNYFYVDQSYDTGYFQSVRKL